MYAKIIPGNYIKDNEGTSYFNYVGFSLIYYDIDNNPDTDNSKLFAYVFGQRDDVEADTVNHFSKIFM